MIENHVVNLDLSKQLYDLGIKKPSLFYWQLEDQSDIEKYKTEWIVLYGLDENIFRVEKSIIYPAYLATELLEILPYFINHKNDCPNYYLYISHAILDDVNKIKKYWIGYHSWVPFSEEKIPSIDDELLPNALAKMLIYLVENKLVEV
jgi:hypothetical protein